MGRLFVLSTTLVVLAIFAGCNSSRRKPAMSWLPGFGNSANKKAEKDDPFGTSKTERETKPGKATIKSGDESIVHDAETLKLIRDELRDLPPAERATMMTHLKGQSPATVRMILRQHRLTRNLLKEQQNGNFGTTGNQFAGTGSQSSNSNAFHESNSKGFPGSATNVSFGGHSQAFGHGSTNGNYAMGVTPWQSSTSPQSNDNRQLSRSDGFGRSSTAAFGRTGNGGWPNSNAANTYGYGQGQSSFLNRPDNPFGSSGNGSQVPPSQPGSGFPPANSQRYSPDDLRSGPTIIPASSANSSRNHDPLRDLPRTGSFVNRTLGFDNRERVSPSGHHSGVGNRNREFLQPNASEFGQGNRVPKNSFENPAPSQGLLPIDNRLLRNSQGSSGARLQNSRQFPVGSQPFSANGLKTQQTGSSSADGSRPGFGANSSTRYAIPPMPSNWEAALQRLISATDSLASSTSPGTTAEERYAHLRNQVYLRMLFLMSDQPHQSMQAIHGIDKADQEFWKDTFFALTNYFEPEFMNNEATRAKQTAARLDAAVQHLREKAELEIQQIAFCREIKSFGNYEPFEKNEFREGDPVLVYAEVANFKSVPVENGMFQTRLRSSMVLYKAGLNGRRQTKVFKFRPTIDLCRTRRRDYFLSYAIEIPKQIGFGQYVMELTITDEHGNKVATDSINFSIKP